MTAEAIKKQVKLFLRGALNSAGVAALIATTYWAFFMVKEDASFSRHFAVAVVWAIIGAVGYATFWIARTALRWIYSD